MQVGELLTFIFKGYLAKIQIKDKHEKGALNQKHYSFF
jgi:hypothetical protein